MRLRRIYENGGDVENNDKKQGQGLGLLQIGATIADSVDKPNAFGMQSGATTVLKSTASFAQMGSAFGPVGTGVGAAVGLVKGLVDARKDKEEQKRLQRADFNENYARSISQYQARAAADPTLASGVSGQNYFANGGTIFSKLMNKKLHGGSLSQVSSDTVEVKGRSHKTGGVDLPTGEEVEGGETIKGNYVLSKKLGFADAHKPIAKAIGILERKPATKPVMNSLERLREQEQALILFQEAYRKQHNLA